MNVKIIVGYAHAYACIKHDSISMDVQLDAGHPPEYSLKLSALELRENARKMLRRAEIIEAAITFLANKYGDSKQ